MRLAAGLLISFWLATLSRGRPATGVSMMYNQEARSSPPTNGSSAPGKEHASGMKKTEPLKDNEGPPSVQRYVFAHVVAGNAQNYSKEQWLADS